MRTTLAALLALAGCGVRSSSTTSTLAIHAAVCGQRCATGDASRAPGDFTGLACAIRARLRLYRTSGGALGAVDAEKCVDLSDPAAFAALFPVTSGVPGGTSVAGGMPTQLAPSSGGPWIAEIALVAPGASASCSDDAPLVAIGRSAPFSAGHDEEVDVELGCHELCDDLAARTGSIAFHDAATFAPSAAPASLTLGDLHDEGLLLGDGPTCSAGESAFPTATFLPYDAGALAGTQLAATIGEDTGPNGGCTALSWSVGSTRIYGCLDDLASATPAVATLDQAAVTSILAQAAKQKGRAGALVLLFRDASGMPVTNLELSKPNVDYEGVTGDFVFDVTVPFTSKGILVVPEAPAGTYVVTPVGASPSTTFWAGGAEPGSITLVEVRPSN